MDREIKGLWHSLAKAKHNNLNDFDLGEIIPYHYHQKQESLLNPVQKHF